MADSGLASFPYVPILETYSPLKPQVRIKNDLAEMVIRWPSTKVAKRNLIHQKNMDARGKGYRSKANFKNLLWNRWSEFKIIW